MTVLLETLLVEALAREHYWQHQQPQYVQQGAARLEKRLRDCAEALSMSDYRPSS